MEALPTIEILYTCDSCGIKNQKVVVIARTTQNVVEWVQRVAAYAISADHAGRSPHCKATTMTDMKIPVSGTDKVGGA